MTASITGDFSQVDDLFLNRQDAIEAIGEREVSQLEQLGANLRTTLSNKTVQRQQLLANNALQYYQTEQTYKNDYKGNVITAFQNHYVGGGTDDNLQTVIDDIALRSNNLFSTAELRTLAEQGKALARGETRTGAGGAEEYNPYPLAGGNGRFLIYNKATGEWEAKSPFEEKGEVVGSSFESLIENSSPALGRFELGDRDEYHRVADNLEAKFSRDVKQLTLQGFAVLFGEQLPAVDTILKAEIENGNERVMQFYWNVMRRMIEDPDDILNEATIEDINTEYADVFASIINALQPSITQTPQAPNERINFTPELRNTPATARPTPADLFRIKEQEEEEKIRYVYNQP